MLKRLFLAAALLLAAHSSYAAVIHNAHTADANSATGVTSINTATLSPVAGSNIVLVGIINLEAAAGAAAPTAITAKFGAGATSMTQIGSFFTASSNGKSGGSVFCLAVGSSTTSGTIQFAWTNTATPYVQAVAFSNANQTTPCANFVHNNGNTGTSMTLAMTSGANDGVIQIGGGDNGSIAKWSATTVGVNLYNDTTGNQNSWADYALGSSVGANPTFNDTNVNTGTEWTQVGATIQAVAATCSKTLASLGAGC